MTRRDFTLLGLSAGGAAAFGGLAAAQDRPGAKGAVGHKAGDPTLLTCAKACSDCQRECDGCATHCAELLQKGERDHFTTLQTCLDCADVCAAASHVVARGGPFTHLICEACIDACAKCGAQCAKFPASERMKACAAECRRCEEACREMLQHGHDTK